MVWKRAADLNGARTGHAAVWHDDQLYVFGGSLQNGASVPPARYNPATDTWTDLPNPPDLILGEVQAHSDGTLIWVFAPQGYFRSYNPTAGTWSAALPVWSWVERDSNAFSSTLDATGDLWVFGGLKTNVVRWDASAAQWVDEGTSSGEFAFTDSYAHGPSVLVNGWAYFAISVNQGLGGRGIGRLRLTDLYLEYLGTNGADLPMGDPGDFGHRVIALPGNQVAVPPYITQSDTRVKGTWIVDPATATYTQADIPDFPDTAVLSYAGHYVAITSLGDFWYVGGRDDASLQKTAQVSGWVENSTPNAPIPLTLIDDEVIDRAITNRAAWEFSDPDAGDSQSKYDLRYRLVGAPSWTTVSGTTPNSFHDFAGGSLAAGDYEWQVRTYDAQGLVGPYSSSEFFTAADRPGQPTITAPVNNASIPLPDQVVEWSAPGQDTYQLRRVADNAGAPNTAVIYQDTGEVNSSGARSRAVTFAVNNRVEHVQVRVKNDGLWSAWASVRVTVSYTQPAGARVTVTVDDQAGSLTVAMTNPTPVGDQPAASHHDVLIDDGDGHGMVRKARDVPAGSAWTYHRPRGGWDYAGRIAVITYGTNGTNGTTTITAP